MRGWKRERNNGKTQKWATPIQVCHELGVKMVKVKVKYIYIPTRYTVM